MTRRFHVAGLVGILVVVALSACATLQTGADPVLVRAEQTLEISFTTIDGLLFVEKYHRAELEKVVPNAHQVAETLRVRAPEALRAATRAIDVYRIHRTPEAKADLATWLAVVQQLAYEAQRILASYGGGK